MDGILDQGLVISLVGIVIVFLALVFLSLFFTYLSKVLNRETKKKLVREGVISKDTNEEDLVITGDVSAAIAMALYLNSEIHDEESTILTIKKVSRTYSPWSSKIYGLRRSPR